MAGGFEPLIANGFCHSENAKAGSISKFWMLFVFHDSFDHALSGRTDSGSPSNYAFRRESP